MTYCSLSIIFNRLMAFFSPQLGFEPTTSNTTGIAPKIFDKYLIFILFSFLSSACFILNKQLYIICAIVMCLLLFTALFCVMIDDLAFQCQLSCIVVILCQALCHTALAMLARELTFIFRGLSLILTYTHLSSELLVTVEGINAL